MIASSDKSTGRSRHVHVACVAVMALATVVIGTFAVVLAITVPYWHVINAYIGTGINVIAVIAVAWGASLGYLVVAFTLLVRSIKTNAFVFHRGAYIILPALLASAWVLFYFILWFLAGYVLSVFVRILGNMVVYFTIAASCCTLVVLWFAARPARGAVAVLRNPGNLPARQKLLGWLLVSTLVAMICCGFILPLVSRPSTVTNLSLPPKPLVIGHRGSSNYAPENTLAAGNACLLFGIAGWEVDVQVSLDGVFFLMHDDTLQRTTNVEDVFPGRAGVDAAWFNFSDIQQLDAGSWFADEDPYYTIIGGVVPASVAQGYRGTRVPSLQEAINFTRAHGMIIDIDFKRPPDGHPCHETARGDMVAMLATSGLGKQAWVSSSSAVAENLTRVTSNTDVETFLSSNYDLVNTGLAIPNDNLRMLHDNGIPVVVYTVNDILSFSELWVYGATYVKSDRPWELTGLSMPVMYVPTGAYVAAWVVLYGFALVVVSLRAVRKRTEARMHVKSCA